MEKQKPLIERVNSAIAEFRQSHQKEPTWLLIGHLDARRLGIELRRLYSRSIFINTGDIYEGLKVTVSSRQYCVVVGLTMMATG